MHGKEKDPLSCCAALGHGGLGMVAACRNVMHAWGVREQVCVQEMVEWSNDIWSGLLDKKEIEVFGAASEQT